MNRAFSSEAAYIPGVGRCGGLTSNSDTDAPLVEAPDLVALGFQPRVSAAKKGKRAFQAR
jgi:hypothetical protein